MRELTICNCQVLHTGTAKFGADVRQVSAFLGVLKKAAVSAAHACARTGRPPELLKLGDPAWRASFDQSPVAALLVDAASLRIVGANAEFRRSCAISEQEIAFLTLPALFPQDADSEATTHRWRDPDPEAPLLVRQSLEGHQIEIELRGYRFVSEGRQLLIYWAQDVTSRSQFENALLENQKRLDHLAHHDQLTGLPNRLFLAANLPAAISEAERNGRMLAILFLDLDRFKHINDSRGHDVGDALLKAVAERLGSVIRSSDIVVRMGGDEFIVVLQEVVNIDRVNETAERLIDSVSSPMSVQGRPMSITVSIGVSLYPRDGADMSELLRHSDTAMYQAKELGRNNCQVFSVAMDSRLRQKIAVESHLRAALKSAQLEVHYQPIVDIETCRVASMEALVRWRHPEYGLVPPGRFIGIAEETGLIVPIGEFVIQQVVDDLARWRDEQCELVPIAINVSAVQLQRTDLASTIKKMTQARGLPAGIVQVELTESSIFERRLTRDGNSNQDAVTRLRERGIQIAIDDFGTGYSSLAYLKHWRFDFLKIDRTFVRDLVTDPSDLAIVGAIVAMARHLEIPVIAEGIEGWQQLEKLRELWCRLAQGYLLARPAPAADCARYLTGAPLVFATRDRRFDSLDSTGISAIQIADLLSAGQR